MIASSLAKNDPPSFFAIRNNEPPKRKGAPLRHQPALRNRSQYFIGTFSDLETRINDNNNELKPTFCTAR
ncbi:MAG: hypothetical protein R8K48_02190 [Gallionella sp.]